MERENLLTIIKSYKTRVNSFKILEGKDGMRRRSSIEKMLIADRRRSVSWFCSDAKYLKKIDCDTQYAPLGKMPASQFSPQYYLLEDEDLLSYFGFRTALRIGEVPKIINAYFISLYLMEILNGIYGDDVVVIEKKIDGVFALLLQKEKKSRLKKHLIAAYGNLVFLHGNPDLAAVYEEKIGYELFPHKAIAEVSTCAFPFLVKLYKLDSHKFVSPSVLYVMEHCYQEMVSAAFDEGYECDSFKENNTKYLFQMEKTSKPIEGIKPLFVDFPLLPSFSIAHDASSFYQSKNGRLFEVQAGLNAYSETITGEFLENLLRVAVVCLGGPKEAMQEFSAKPNEEFSYFNRIAHQRKKNQHCIYISLMNWLKSRPYLRRSYLSSVSDILKKKQIAQFSIDTSSIDKIRKESASIQDKLIIEEEGEHREKNHITLQSDSFSLSIQTKGDTNAPQSSLLSGDKKAYTPSGRVQKKTGQSSLFSEEEIAHYGLDPEYLTRGLAKIQSISSSDTPAFMRFASKLETCLSIPKKYVILLLFLKEPSLSEIYCRSQNLMLSVVIDEINQRALEFIDDVLIEENEVLEDYYGLFPLLFRPPQKHSEIKELVAKIAAQKKTDQEAVQRLKELKAKTHNEKISEEEETSYFTTLHVHKKKPQER